MAECDGGNGSALIDIPTSLAAKHMYTTVF